MSTTVARSRARRAANSTGWFEEPPATRNTRSAPSPPGGLRQRLLHRGRALVVRRRAQQGARLLGQPASVLVGIEPDHLDAGGHEQLDDQLPDQAQPDDARGIPDLDVALANTLQGDRTHGGEGGQLGRHAVGHRHAEIGRYPIDLGVEGELVPGARHELTDSELLSPFPHLLDDARQASTPAANRSPDGSSPSCRW